MVGRVIQIVYKEIRGLHHAAYVIALFTFGAQLLALVRDRLLAGAFGAGEQLDLYYAAFRIPDLLFVLFASALSVYVLIPFVTSVRHKGGDRAVRAFLSDIFTIFLVAYVVLAFAVGLSLPALIPLLFPGLAAHTDTLTLLTRILLLQPFLLGLSALVSVVTQLEHRFLLYALSPILYNVGIIFGLLALYPPFGLAGLSAGVVLGALGHLLIQLPFMFARRMRPRFSFSVDMRRIGAVLAVSAPRALTLSLHQIVLLVLVGVGSVMAAGSVSVFQFAINLQSVPLAIIGVSYSVAAFPMLAQLFSEGKRAAFLDHVLTALRHVLFWSVPVLTILIVIRAQFVRVVLGSGAFDWDDTRLTAAVFALLLLAVTAQAAHLLLVRALYAAGNTRLPFLITLFSSAATVALAFLLHVHYVASVPFQTALSSLLRLEGVAGAEVVVLALAYTAGLLLHGALLLFFSARHLHMPVRPLFAPCLHALFAALCGGAVAYGVLLLAAPLVAVTTLLGIFLQGAAAGSAGIAAAVAAYALVGSPELSEVYRSVRKRIQKTPAAAPQNEDRLAV